MEAHGGRGIPSKLEFKGQTRTSDLLTLYRTVLGLKHFMRSLSQTKVLVSELPINLFIQLCSWILEIHERFILIPFRIFMFLNLTKTIQTIFKVSKLIRL